MRTDGGKDRYLVSENIRRHGYARAFSEIKSALTSKGLRIEHPSFDDDAICRLENAFSIAEDHHLLGPGGVPHWNFLGLWLVNYLLGPIHYLESGYFRGSSLLAALGNPRLLHLSGFDPEPGNLALSDFPRNVNVEFAEQDFGQAAPENTHGEDALVYFDDHINTAQRILEANDKGYRRLIFDDSCGLTGTSQRHWPSMPTVYFIIHADKLEPGDFIEWPSPVGRSLDGSGGQSQLRVTFDAELIDITRQAKRAISAHTKLPDLSDHILWRSAARYPDVTQHLILLNGK